MGEACPTFAAPHHFMFGRIIRVIRLYIEKQIYDRLHAVAKEYNGVPFVSTSVDLWTSKHSQQGFAAMDIQYGNPFTATIDSFTLAVKYFPEEHTHDVLVDFIKNVSSYYGFVSVLAWILVASIDGGSNIVLACQVLGICRIYCYTHRLHLSVKRALGQYGKPSVNKLVAKLMVKVRGKIGHFTRSPKNTGILLRIQREDGPSQRERALRLMQDTVVR